MKIFSSAFALPHKSAGINAPADWIPSGVMHGAGGAVRSNTGIVVTEQTALFNSAVFACQRAISESLAILPKGIFQSDLNGGHKPDLTHKSNQVLKLRANPLLSAYHFTNLSFRNALNHGDSFSELQFHSKTGEVVAAWPIPSHCVEPKWVLSKNGEPDIVYLINLPERQRKAILTKDRILHIPGLGFDGRRGYPLVYFMAQAVGLGQAIEEFGSKFFKNGAGVDGYVTIPENYTWEQIKNLQTHYDMLNSGLDNAHRFKFLYDSSKFSPSGLSPLDSQMIDSRIFQIQEVARFHRMVLHKIQETSKATGYNSLEQFNTEFVNDTLMPWIVSAEQEINWKFFDPEENRYVKFNTNALLRGDAKSRAAYYRTMVFTSIMTPNEARRLEDLPPIDGGDKRLIPANMMIDGEDPGDNDERSMDANERVQD